MTAPARCERTDLPVDGCAHCRPSPQPEPIDYAHDITVVFTAQYGGTCEDCCARFEPGDRIGRLREGGYLGPECLP